MTFYIVGAGGFGRETLDALRAMSPDHGVDVAFVDDHVPARAVDGVPICRPEQASAGVWLAHCWPAV
jgi:PglD N-terminal domain